VREIAAVVPDQYDASGVPEFQSEDVESGTDLKSRRSGLESNDYASVVSSETPFFHIDLAGAVKAAESGLGRVSN